MVDLLKDPSTHMYPKSSSSPRHEKRPLPYLHIDDEIPRRWLDPITQRAIGTQCVDHELSASLSFRVTMLGPRGIFKLRVSIHEYSYTEGSFHPHCGP